MIVVAEARREVAPRAARAPPAPPRRPRARWRRALVDADHRGRPAVVARDGVGELGAELDRRPTSRTRRNEPSGLARRTTLANCSGSVSRPWVVRLSWNSGSSVIGCAPIRPIAAWTFCALQRRDDVAGRDAEAGQPVDVEDDAHRVVERAEQRGVADARHPLQRVEHVDRGVVGQEEPVMRPGRRS